MSDLPPLIPLQQSDRYLATLRLMGRDAVNLRPGDDAPLVMLRRRFGPLQIGYLPRVDLSGDRRAALRALPHHMTRIVIEEAEATAPGVAVLTPQYIAELNVPKAPVHDALWSNMHPKWRNRLRRGLEGPVRVTQSRWNAQAHAGLLRLELRQRRRRGYRSYPEGFLAAYAKANPHNTCLFQAKLGDDTVAYMLFLLHGPVATYAVGYTSVEGRAQNAHTRLMYEAMRSLFAKGIMRLDLGSVDDQDGRDLARFKLGCGARVRALGPVRVVLPGQRIGRPARYDRGPDAATAHP